MLLTLEVTGPEAEKLGAGARMVFRDAGGTIGRLADNAWVLPDSYVSGRHAVIRFHDNTFYIEDTSTNGVFINTPDNPLARGRPHALKSGDWIFIEPYEIRVLVTGESHQGAASPFDDLASTIPSAPAAGNESSSLPFAAERHDIDVDPLTYFPGSAVKPATSFTPRAISFPGRKACLAVTDPTPFAYGRSSVLFRTVGPDGTDLCVKLFTQVHGNTWDGDGAFEREVKAQSELIHQHILPVWDYGLESSPHRSPFVVFPYCSGGNLRDLLQERRYHPLALVMPLLKQMASALDFAHASGYVHGDVKPENVLFSADRERAFLSDFGMSNVFAVQESFSTTIRGARGGTTAYFSPEQLSENQQTPLSDIYAFVLMTYELLTGHLPFDPRSPTFKQMQAKVTGQVTDPRHYNPQIGDQVRAGLLAGLHVNPLLRPRSALQFCEIIAGEQVVDSAGRPAITGSASVFVSYSHHDVRWLERIRVHLRPLERMGLLDLWHDQRIKPGDRWRAAIDQALRRAKCAVVLVSADFLASEFCTQEEFPILLQQAEARGVRILPLMLSPCQADAIPGLSSFQGINSPDRTLVEMDRGEQERMLLALAEAIKETVSTEL